jgi:nuclear protein localization family protein 4
MIIRLRSRDGLERVELPDDPSRVTVDDLRAAVLQRLNLPTPEDLVALSTDPRLLTAKTDDDVRAAAATTPALNDASPAAASTPLAQLTPQPLGHGALLFVLYRGERSVEPAVKPETSARPFGARLTVDDVSARTVRIERQDKAKCESVSFDRSAADAFQRYVQGALGFSRARAGWLYGSSDDEGNVRVEWVYEPPQEGGKNVAVVRRDAEEEKRADAVASAFGLKRVGWVLAQAVDKSRDCILSDVELRQAACVQDECGELGVTVLVTWDDAGDETAAGAEGRAGGHVHFEAFQCSAQAVKLWREGWFAPLKGEAAGVADPPKAEEEEEGGKKEEAAAAAAAANGAAAAAPAAPRVGHTLSGKRPKGSASGSSSAPAPADNNSNAYAPSGRTRMQYPQDPSAADPVLLAGRGADEVDNDYFLCPVKILDHSGPLLAHFPVENRLVPQTRDDLRAQLRRLQELPYEKRLADAHLLLWLGSQPNLDSGDVEAVCAAAAGKTGPLMEGYRVILDSIAGV